MLQTKSRKFLIVCAEDVIALLVHKISRFAITRMTTSREKYQQHKHAEQQQVNAALQNVCFATGKCNHARCQG